jgi:hypothetical protein
VTKPTKLETEEKRIVRGATPEEELKAKQLSDEAHVERKATKQLQVCKNQFHRKDTKDLFPPLEISASVFSVSL